MQSDNLMQKTVNDMFALLPLLISVCKKTTFIRLFSCKD